MGDSMVGGVDFRPLVLLNDVARCKGFERSSWVSKGVAFLNEAGDDVAKALCHSVDSSLVPQTNGRPLGRDFVCVQIAESLLESDIPFGWIYSLLCMADLKCHSQ